VKGARSCSGQRAQVAPQAVGAGTWNQAVDLGMRASPDGNGAREQRAASARFAVQIVTLLDAADAKERHG
jgi:hypothetical protein